MRATSLYSSLGAFVLEGAGSRDYHQPRLSEGLPQATLMMIGARGIGKIPSITAIYLCPRPEHKGSDICSTIMQHLTHENSLPEVVLTLHVIVRKPDLTIFLYRKLNS